ncbi:TPA: hypothetical protein NKA88_004480 [Vibrio parahaemolyticus]|uniref:hypothetical protein n=2 Tax=Vibrio parahaemolyticus TaxID=670 RepID=UPI000B1E9574|nr:hypothetical protein [Vibrio parahaemolyticus]EII5666381.1 hypothetical protein [Vibrio parahaemolyticus]EJG1707388.1 hypothetical protein [Vibrio parahaemolyticus]EJG2240428.1 hypothetical protein [Vibrio parahaemolyticus]EJG2249496.1 hypothetical protein [Vibrio parahaemolyticus]EKB7881308.1 hypothetical protein [Vibrio parahaemolyticus]
MRRSHLNRALAIWEHMKIYIDHNVLDALSKEHFKLEVPDTVTWIYSHETFAEIKRSGDLRFLDVLKDLKAQKLELILDSNFRITGDAFFHDYRDPYEFYQQWLDAISQCATDEQLHLQFLSRVAGGDNHQEILKHPDRIRNLMKSLLQPHGLYTSDVELEVDKVAMDIQNLVQGSMQEIGSLSDSRTLIGTGRGRAGNTSSSENPIEALWSLVKGQCGEFSIDQYFGFDPIDKQGYEEWPLYLGVIGCHSVLNFLGFHSDRGLNKVEKIPGILSDGAHTGMAIYCDAILSKDQKFCAKARAIYGYLGLKTQVLEISLTHG